MSEVSSYLTNLFIQLLETIKSNGERFFWIVIGGYIQIHLAQKKGVKFNRTSIITAFIIAGFVGYWSAELAETFGMIKISNFIASISAIASHSLLSYYNDNLVTIVKAVVKGKFKIDLDENKDGNNRENLGGN